jgi:prephenate dehydrogenase
MAASFVTLLGAQVYFADLAEVDGIMAAIHTLPALAAAALMETVIDQPGWSEIRKLAGRPFIAAMHQLDGEDALALAEAVQKNRVNTVRMLDENISALQSLRDEIDKEEISSLQERFERVLIERAQWRRMRTDGDWRSSGSPKQEISPFNETWRQQLGLGKLFGGRNKKTGDD